MRVFALVASLLFANPLWAQPAVPVDSSDVSMEVQATESEAGERDIVVITEAEFVPISKYFESFDPNQLEPSAAGPLQSTQEPH